jgi:predicted thioesterase
MEITIGTTHTEETVVDERNVASALGSGLVDVYATPMMIALMELAASECVKPCLKEGEVTVGGHVNVSHIAATPIGMKVTAAATVTAKDRSRVEFAVVMRDEAGEIGSGTHTRFIVNKEKFTKRAAEKARR